MHINQNILQCNRKQNSHRFVINRFTQTKIITFWLNRIFKKSRCSYLAGHPVFLEVAGEPRHLLTCSGKSHLLFWPPGWRTSGLYMVVWRPCQRHIHTQNPPHQQSSCFLLVEKCRWLPLISPLVSDHLPGSAAALWRSTGISLWQRLNETFHHNERPKLVHCVAVLAQNIIKNLSLYIKLSCFFF